MSYESESSSDDPTSEGSPPGWDPEERRRRSGRRCATAYIPGDDSDFDEDYVLRLKPGQMRLSPAPAPPPPTEMTPIGGDEGNLPDARLPVAEYSAVTPQTVDVPRGTTPASVLVTFYRTYDSTGYSARGAEARATARATRSRESATLCTRVADAIAGAMDGAEAWFIKRTSPRYQHCQVSFILQDGNTSALTFSSTMRGRGVEALSTQFVDSNWVGIHVINITAAQRRNLLAWCIENDRKPFNAFGYYYNFMPLVCGCCAYDARGSAFFCAEHVATALRSIRAPGFDSIYPFAATPDEVFDRLNVRPNSVMHVRMKFPKMITV